MRKRLFIIALIVFQIFFSCEKEYSNSELKANFTEEQISDLNEIRDFFVGQICDYDFKSCFKEINHDSLEALGSGVWEKIDFDKQKELYKKISQTTFSEIWMFCETTYYPSKTKAQSLCAVATGKYQKYLSDIGKSNPRIAKYAEQMEASGDFNGLYLRPQEVLNNKHSFDLNDPNIQIILAIHHLTMNDQTTRNSELVILP